MTEYEIIRSIAEKFPRHSDQLNGLFECDAELIRMGDQIWGLSMDDFSPEEDLFTADPPELLGANLAVATLSDLYAAGVEPRFFMHSLSISKTTSRSFLNGLTNGIQSVLNEANCFLCGGDFGTTDTWRYCGFAMGPVVSTRPLTRKLTGRPAALWVTGQLGDANLAALQKKTTPAFELRNQESEVIRKHATGCMDTSGGFMDALWTLHTLNSKIRIELHAEKIPIATGIYEFAHSIGIPPETALVGGAGEYELLFSTPDDLSDSAKTELEKMGMTRIADLSTNPNTGIFICQTGKPVRGMTTPPPCPRAIHSTTDYINAVASFAADLFGEDR